jgi:L-arabinokinase
VSFPTLAFYVSGHGFGHASRQVEIINAFAARRPDVPLLLRTSVAEWLLRRTIAAPFELDPRPVDTGVVQIDSLRLDESASFEQARAFYAGFAARAEVEAALLRERHVGLVVVDAPPLGCEAAARAGIPSIVIANFTWDHIYADYPAFRAAPEIAGIIQAAYRKAKAAWRLPMHCGFETFDTIVDVPFVARRSDKRTSRAEVRETLGVRVDRPMALVSFGGYGAAGPRLSRPDCLEHWTVVTTGDASFWPDGVHVLQDAEVYRRGLRYCDVVAASEAVVTKPGYGIISECIANGAPMLYTSRGHFIEYSVLVREMPRYLRCRFIDSDTLIAGRWLEHLEALRVAPPPPEQPAIDGADVVAGMLDSRLRTPNC